MRIPAHIGIIPDGNRRWAKNAGLAKQEGYAYGLSPGLDLLHLAREAGVQELTYYGTPPIIAAARRSRCKPFRGLALRRWR